MKKMNKFNMNSEPFLTSKNGFPPPQIKPPPVFDPNRRDATYSSLQIYLHPLISITPHLARSNKRTHSKMLSDFKQFCVILYTSNLH